jgi:hypothetical protein
VADAILMHRRGGSDTEAFQVSAFCLLDLWIAKWDQSGCDLSSKTLPWSITGVKGVQRRQPDRDRLLMRRAIAVLWAMVLGGCSLSGAIEKSSTDYNVTVEYVTNNMLVENILRARDQAPLHFTDLSLIHGSLQLQTSLQANLPFGNVDVANQRTRNIANAAVSVSSSPSFDVAPLNTSKFTTGLFEPISVSYFQEYLHEGVPQALLMRLLVDKIDFIHPPDTHHPLIICSYENVPSGLMFGPVGPSGGADQTASCPPPGFPPPPNPAPSHGMASNGPAGVWDFDSLVRAWRLPLILHTYERLTPFGPQVSFNRPDTLSDLARATNSSMLLRPVPGHSKEYQFYKETQSIALCIPGIDDWLGDTPWHPAKEQPRTPSLTPGDVADSTDTPEGACWQPTATVSPTDKHASDARHRWRVYVHLRSVLGIFEYLGKVIKQGVPPAAPRDPFALNFYIKPGLSPEARFNVLYEGAFYHVDDATPYDNTLQILSILNQLLNTLKNANEIPSTQSVEALP